MPDLERVYALLVDLKGDMGDLKGDIGGLRSDVRNTGVALREHVEADEKIAVRIAGLERREARAKGWAAATATFVSACFAIGVTWFKGHGG